MQAYLLWSENAGNEKYISEMRFWRDSEKKEVWYTNSQSQKTE